jgi:AmmeMemoRadiSam system protein A
MSGLDVVGPSLPDIAREAIRTRLSSGQRLVIRRLEAPAAPVFVTLRSPDGSLRGCIGSLVAAERDVAQETARSAVLAATRDPRFPEVTAEELPGLHIEVSVLMPEEPISGISELDPARYGVVVRDGFGRQGLLLPDVPGVTDAAMQVEIARRKAGIEPEARVTLRRFEVRKFEEPRGRAGLA